MIPNINSSQQKINNLGYSGSTIFVEYRFKEDIYRTLQKWKKVKNPFVRKFIFSKNEEHAVCLVHMKISDPGRPRKLYEEETKYMYRIIEDKDKSLDLTEEQQLYIKMMI